MKFINTMKKYLPYCFLLIACLGFSSRSFGQTEFLAETIAAVTEEENFLMPDPQAIFDSMPQPAVNYDIVNLSLVPRVFSGYRKIHHSPQYSQKNFYDGLKNFVIINGDELQFDEITPSDTLNTQELNEMLVAPLFKVVVDMPEDTVNNMPSILEYQRPQWFENALRTRSAQEDLQYASMIDNPMTIEYAYWDLPVPPVLLVEDRSFLAFIKRQEIPEVNPDDAILPELETKKTNWLHTVNALLQFSQAYISPNWYQGGNSYLSLLLGFNWNVTLNQVYHPNILFQSNLSYKLALTSNPKGSYHKYTISEDNFQYNLNTGLKAAKDWYYSFNLLFKTQLLTNYDANSDVTTASILSPGDLNLGLGMSYNHTNKLKTFRYTITISPLSYNLKTCISNKVDHATYNIPLDKKTKSEIGSNVEFNMEWNISTNVSYKTRLFAFTDYHYFLGDWQNTFNFEINKFLSTQIFVNLRYDGSTESSGKWKKFMMKELLSFGLSYTFSTKP